ncbi:unnamed protein product [Camellia sinensis]
MSTPENWIICIHSTTLDLWTNGVKLNQTVSELRELPLGEEIYAKVNSLTSIATALPFSYYSLPYCRPHMGIKKSAENLGQLLMGDQIHNSPYRFRMNVNESIVLCTTSPLSEHEVELLKQRTRDLYQVNMILDNLPAMRFAQQNGIKIQWTGFPVGYALPNSNEDYIINHLKFRVLVNEYEGAGVQIIVTGEEGVGNGRKILGKTRIFFSSLVNFFGGPECRFTQVKVVTCSMPRCDSRGIFGCSKPLPSEWKVEAKVCSMEMEF